MKTLLYSSLIIILLGCLTSCTQSSRQAEEEMKTLATRSLDFWNTGDFSMVNEVFNDDFEQHWLSRNIEIVGVDAFVENVTLNRGSAPDFKVVVDDIGASGDRCFVRWTVTSTYSDPNNPAIQNIGVEFSGLSVYRFVDGKISEEWYAYNHADWLAQLGYTFTPPSLETEE